ncbi:MAG: thiamine-phosphate kinase [Alphaproteobacteria bacterium]
MSADEFDIIKTHFAPLANDPAARGLMDDVAVLQADGRVVVTTDTIVEGVHFLPDDPIETIAKKALRVNLSDLAAKGSTPLGFLLGLAWPDTRPAAEIARFAQGLKEDIALYRAPLLGGDTTSTPGPLSVTITAFGSPLGDRVPARADARVGDDVWITGEVGDAWLGLMTRRGKLTGVGREHDAFFILRYQLPEPPMAFAPIVARAAHASMDVSDGLLADAGKLAAASNAHVTFELASIPFSEPARRWLCANEGGALQLIAGGDDYKILFTAPADRRAEIESDAISVGIRATRIGRIETGAGVHLLDAVGAQIAIPAHGYSHKLGR